MTWVNRILPLLKSKTVWSATATAIGWLLAQQHIGMPEIVQAVGGVLTAVGVKDAIHKVSDGSQG